MMDRTLALYCQGVAILVIVIALYYFISTSTEKPRRSQHHSAYRPSATRHNTVWRCADCGAYNSTDNEYCSECGRFYYEDVDALFDEEEDEF